MKMYKISEDNDVKIKQVERLLKESAIDCALNKSRNLLQTDKPNTKECDYMDCEYKCDLVDEDTLKAIKKQLPRVPHIFLSSATGKGLPELKDKLWELINKESL
jgi:50S ribosomal subunit-associated GTPase HflX